MSEVPHLLLVADASGRSRGMTGFRCGLLLNFRLQGYLAHKKMPHPRDSTVALCIGTYGDPRGVDVSYERGTPALLVADASGRSRGITGSRIRTFRDGRRPPLCSYSTTLQTADDTREANRFSESDESLT